MIQLGEGRDYGDAPDPKYKSNNASDGARHIIVPGFSLGAGVTVDGDARLIDADTDDGIQFQNAIVAAFRTSLIVTAQGVSAAQPGFLTAWIDYDGDGDFENNTERLFVGRSITSASTVINNLLIPSTAVTGKTYARFRFSQTPVTSSIGDSSSGEVEDYELTISANPYSNPSNRLDVNNDGFVSPIDALQVLNFLNLNGTTQLTLPVSSALPPYLDVNGDGSVSSIDALQVINFLNARLQGGEGESQEIGWVAADALVHRAHPAMD